MIKNSIKKQAGIIVLNSFLEIYLSLGSLYFSTGRFGLSMYQSYLKNKYIMMFNTLPVILALIWVFYLTKRIWCSFSVVSVITIVFTFVNYFKIKFRDDPFLMEDLQLFSEMKKMVGNYKISFNLDMILWILMTAVIAGVLYKVNRLYFDMSRKERWTGSIIGLVVLTGFIHFFAFNDEYYSKAENKGLINEWGSTQQFISRGYIYPFIYSSKNSQMEKPDGYKKEEAKRILEEYKDDNIPENKKVNIIAIMLEAYSDFSQYPQIEFDEENDPYAAFRRVQEISYHGNVITDIFAGGTVSTERRFITGADDYPNLRKPIPSYARYFDSQGYKVEGSHPCYQWFYNRVNTNENLGFQNYDFYENRYQELANGEIAADYILFQEIYNDLKESIAEKVPYFNFSVTYQNHGPYGKVNWYEKNYLKFKKDYTEETFNILNNYFWGIKSTGEELESLIHKLDKLKEPTVLIAFGDHKPWLGDQSSVYENLGIDFDLTTKKGVYNYYATPYIMYANQTAKDVLDNDFVGKGPSISPNYLMNEFFSLAGYEGSGFMKFTDEVREKITAHSNGVFIENGEVTDTLSPEGQKLWNQYKCVEYYYTNSKVD